MSGLRKKIESAIRDAYTLNPDGIGVMADAVMAVLQEQEPMVTKRKSGLILHAGWDPLPVGAKLYAAPMPTNVPDRLEVDEWFGKDHMYASGWNDCIDAMLAAAPKPGEPT